jgi:FlaA1/EpsC-like NDP-sugar epimerase
MEIKLKEIAIIGGVAALGFYLYKKMKKPTAGKPVATTTNRKKSSSSVVENLPVVDESPTIVLPSTDGTQNQYPIAAVVTSSQEGRQPTGVKVRLKDGDAVKGVPEMVYILKGGEKHPATGTWWFYNFGQDWSNVINVTDETLDFIPTGSTYTINGL